jgi:DNA repair exonuclease SbcCD ATPase subunit
VALLYNSIFNQAESHRADAAQAVSALIFKAMADNLIFPIKFDLEAAVREAQGDADRLLRRLQTTINAKPLAVNLKIPGAGSGSINEINSRLKELVKQWNNLTEAQRITNKTTGEYTAEAKKIIAEYTRLRGASESYAQSLKQIDSAAKKAAKQQEKLAEAAYRGSNAFKNQDGYVSRLVKRLAVYASFQYTSQFLTNIREVTAQFELQRISLGAIIQDQQKANQLFAEIKSFALTSPLKILDLTKYTKQVAAYGFETEKLFDTTKMLADISVGLGVDFGRTVLAYSQVFTTGFLRASEARQMTEQGIPIVDKLAKKLTELNGRIYTAAEVMDMMSKRAISFELVEQVFKDMTSAGGEFYNMQVKQSQTLFGMWSKLGDAAAIMYDQIGNTSSINAGMKLAIRSIESMMRNWKTTARVLDSVAVAMTVYIVGLKNAAIASKALTSAVALENLAHQQQIIRTPKIVAGIIGINNAKKISTLLTGLHTKAVLSEAAATNVLTKGFWKLTAAMLANPWVAAASAIALVGVALFHFIGNTETAAERAEKLNNSVASLKNLDDTTKPLIDTYNELINKTERTAEEQKKLSEVTHELAKQYPGAITAIGNFGEEVELAADKLNQLYQAEKQARMENTRHELEKTEQKITETEEKIARLQAQLQDGTKTVTIGSSITGYTQTVTVQMNDEDKGKILKQIDELRYGEDGQSGLFGLQQSAEAARRALGLIPSEAAQAVEKFGAWKKTFTTFRQQVGDVRVQLFDDSTIAQFGSLEEALKKTAEEYKKNIALVATYDETLKSATLTSEERAKIETERAEADAMANLAEKALKYYNAMSLLNTSTSGSGRKSDPRLQTLQEIANKMAEVNKEYDELLKKEGKTKALADTQKLFASSFKQMEATAKKYKFKLPAFEVPQTIEDVQKWYKAIMDNIKRLKLKNADKVLIELGFKSDKAAIDKQQKDIEKQLKALSDRISRTKTAKEFYEKILGQTGDYDLAAKVSLSIYGDTGYDLQKQLAEQIKEMTGGYGVEVPISIISADNRIDYLALERFVKSKQKELGGIESNAYKELVKIAQDGQKDLAKTYEGYLKDLEKAKTYADKRVELARTTAAKIREIEQNPQLSKEQKAELKRGYQEREDREAAKLEYEAFKDTPLYVQMFEDLEHASTSTLEMMKSRLEALSGVWGTALDPTQLKEIQSRMNEIDEQLRNRNPFKTLKSAYMDYKNAVESVSVQGAVANAGAARKEFYERSRDYGADSAQAREAEKELKARERIVEIARQLTDEQGKQLKGQKALDKAQKIALDNQIQANGLLAIAAAEEQAAIDKAKKEGKDPNTDPAVKAAHIKVEAAREEVNLAQRVSEIVQQNAKTSKTLKENLIGAANQVTQFMQIGADVAQAIGDTMEALGANEDDVQYFNDIATALGDITAGFQGIIDSALSLNVGGIISNAIGVIPNMVKGFVGLFSAGKVRKANKEIERQERILEELEYAYGRLEKAMERVFGSEMVGNIKAQQKNLQAQAEAYRKQAEAERSKGKKTDEDKLRDYENSYRETMDRLAELQGKVAEQLIGSDLSSTARDFAKAWVEAYREFGNTADAMGKKFREMVENMVTEGLMARAMERALKPTFDMIDRMEEGDFYDRGFWERVMETADKGARDANAAGAAIMAWAEQWGYQSRGDAEEARGIAKSVGSATSEEVNANTAALTTQTHYMAMVNENVWAIRRLMEAGTTGAGVTGTIDYTPMMATANAHLSSLPRIEHHIAEIHTLLGRVVTTRGGSWAVNSRYTT